MALRAASADVADVVSGSTDPTNQVGFHFLLP